MRLSMWMIINRLSDLAYSMNVKRTSPQDLRSARLVYAPNCVVLRQVNRDVLCRRENESIYIKDIDLKLAFETIQNIFDIYNDWYSEMVDLAKENKWQNMVDSLSQMLTSPVVLWDANNRVVAMSSTYDEVEVDPEWDYLKQHGFSSYQMIRNARAAAEKEENWDFLRLKKPTFMPYGSMCTRIRSNGMTYGYVSCLEVNRELNDGDEKLLRCFTELIGSPFILYCDSLQSKSTLNCFYELLAGKEVERDVIEYQLSCMEMAMDHRFYVTVIEAKRQAADLDAFRKNLLFGCPPMPLLKIANRIVAITDMDTASADIFSKRLVKFCKDDDYGIGRSQVCYSLMYAQNYYQQALFALECPAEHGSVRHFVDHAIEYIIINSDRQKLRCACHGGIKQLFFGEPRVPEDWLKSLETYLSNERSLILCSKLLFLHKNTLTYRIRKMENLCGTTFSDPYEREYALLSIRILRWFKEP